MKTFFILLSLVSSAAFAQSVSADTFKVVAQCQEQDYIDILPGNSIFTIALQGSSYTPKCLRIKKGTSIAIQASSRHPLQGIPDLDSNLVNPIYDELGGAVENRTYTFNDVGVFGYYCLAHGNDAGQGMAGAIYVTE